MTIQRTCTAFCGARQVASGPYSEVALEVQQLGEPVVIFDDETGRSIDFDLRGTADEIRNRFSGAPPAGKEPPRGPGRPRLGVVAREVTLLPRHWEWLGTQPGGASVALRKLVEAARMDKSGAEAVRRAQAAADRFMMVMAGHLPGYEEATRALYAGDDARFATLIEGWPADVRVHARKLSAVAFEAGRPSSGAT